MFSELTPTRPEACPADLTLHAYRADELDAGETQRVRTHLQTCKRCAGRVRELEQQEAAYFESNESRALRERLVQTAQQKQRRRRAFMAAPVLALAAAALLAVLPMASREAESTRMKGASRVGFFVKHGERVRAGHDGEQVQPGDLLRFTYTVSHSAYLLILSCDAQKHASVYASSLAAPGLNVPLQSSVELDDTLGREEIYALFCSNVPTADTLLRELERTGGKLTPPAGCELDVQHIMKVRGL